MITAVVPNVVKTSFFSRNQNLVYHYTGLYRNVFGIRSAPQKVTYGSPSRPQERTMTTKPTLTGPKENASDLPRPRRRSPGLEADVHLSLQACKFEPTIKVALHLRWLTTEKFLLYSFFDTFSRHNWPIDHGAKGYHRATFRFCCSVWGCCMVTKLQTLQKLQNGAARIVTKSSFDTPSIGLIQSLNWPTVSDIFRSETATTVFKSLNGLAPEYLSSLFEKKSTRNVREPRNTETDLSIPLRKTNNGQRAISFC